MTYLSQEQTTQIGQLLRERRRVLRNEIREGLLKSQANVARENVVGGANAIFAGTSGSALIADGGGNLNIDPRFDAVGCQGFHPAEPAAQAYGRWAP